MTAETKTESELPEGYAVETWTYAGRRLASKGGLLEKWIDHEGKPRLFKKLASAPIVGGYYDVTCQVAEGGGVTVSGEPAFRAGSARDPQADEWTLQDRAAITEQQAAAALRRLQREDQMGDLTLNRARALLAGATGGQRTAMLAQILRHLGA